MNSVERTRSLRSDEPLSIWEELAQEPLLEQSEPITIERSYARRLFGGYYEHMGTLILVNLMVTVQVLLGSGVGLVVGTLLPSGARLVAAAAVTVLFAGPAFAGLFTYIRAICDVDAMPALLDYWRGMRKLAVKSWILLIAQVATGALLALNFRFYASIHAGIGTIVLLLIVMLAAIWAMAGSYAWPLLVRDMPWRLLVRNAFFLALAAPVKTLAMVLILTIVTGTLALITRGVFAGIFLFSIWALAENVTLQHLVRIFQAKQAAFETADSSQESASTA